MRPTDAEIEKALRYNLARVLKADDCPCVVCLIEQPAAFMVADVLAWVLGRPINKPHLFAGHLADLYGREDIAKLAFDPRIAKLLPAGSAGQGAAG